MNVLYEEEGDLKVGGILADNTTSLQVEAPHGKRSKIKAAAVLLRFGDPQLGEFLGFAQRAAQDIDIDFLWECSSGEEFGFDALAREYYGHAPGPVEAAAVLTRLHAAPMYFYKRGRGRYKAAPPEALKAALASVERKKEQTLRKQGYVAELGACRLPAEFAEHLASLLYKPDRNSLEWKALEEASAAAKVAPVRLLERCGGVPSTHDYHLNRFLFEFFPRGAAFSASPTLPATGEDLPVADVEAFSIDDASTTEIDDAFSVTPLGGGAVRVGIHIAVPALGVAPASPLDQLARERQSTVYFPGAKITMLPPEAIGLYTLKSQRASPALSLYVELDAAHAVVASETRLERVSVSANLRHEELEPLFNDETLAQGSIVHAQGAALETLWHWAQHLGDTRRGGTVEAEQRAEYTFRIDGDRVHIARRIRGSPIDKLVSELMIYVNSAWGRQLAASGTPAIYRVQGAGKVRMSTVPAAHAGLGVEQYVWASSPLRRYIDLVNQHQMIALAGGAPPPYAAGSPELPAIMREFESAYEAYAEFQRTMERYWSLRWLLQEGVTSVGATILRENLCRFEMLPLAVRVPSVPELPAGTRVLLELSNIDLLELTLHCEFTRVVERTAADTEPGATPPAPVGLR